MPAGILIKPNQNLTIANSLQLSQTAKNQSLDVRLSYPSLVTCIIVVWSDPLSEFFLFTGLWKEIYPIFLRYHAETEAQLNNCLLEETI